MLTLGVPVGAVLEGGYDLDGAGRRSTVATMEALVEGGEPGAHPRRAEIDASAAEVLAPLVAALTQPAVRHDLLGVGALVARRRAGPPGARRRPAFG